MQAGELPQLAQRLNELADYYEAKQPTTAALKVWHDTLKPCLLSDVMFVLTDWPKTNARMPKGDIVLKLCQERALERNVDRSKADAAATISAALARAGAQQRGPESQAIFEREMAKIRAVLSAGKPHPRSWMDRLREREADGEILVASQRWCLEEAEKRVFGSVAAAAAARRRGITAVQRSQEDERMTEAALEAKRERDAMQGEAA